MRWELPTYIDTLGFYTYYECPWFFRHLHIQKTLRLTRTGNAFHGNDTHKRCGSVIYALLSRFLFVSSTFSFLQFSPMIWETGWNQTRVQTVTMPCHHLNRIILRRNQVESLLFCLKNYREFSINIFIWSTCRDINASFQSWNSKIPQIPKHPVCVKSASAQHGSAMIISIRCPKIHQTRYVGALGKVCVPVVDMKNLTLQQLLGAGLEQFLEMEKLNTFAGWFL